MQIRSIVLLLTLFPIAGCSAIPVEQCMGQNWYAKGYQDARNGLGTQQFLTYHNNCALHGITPHRTNYLSGWVQGRETDPNS